MIFAYIENIAYTLAVLLTLKTLLTHSPSVRRRRCRNPKCHLTRKLLKPAQVAKVVNTERERQGKTPKLKVCPSWPLYQPSPQFQVMGPGVKYKQTTLLLQLLLSVPLCRSPSLRCHQPPTTICQACSSSTQGQLQHVGQ
jgi:hypothetical protein